VSWAAARFFNFFLRPRLTQYTRIRRSRADALPDGAVYWEK